MNVCFHKPLKCGALCYYNKICLIHYQQRLHLAYGSKKRKEKREGRLNKYKETTLREEGKYFFRNFSLTIGRR
jgi:hypothetical protein